jgi:hypothetical protein
MNIDKKDLRTFTWYLSICFMAALYGDVCGVVVCNPEGMSWFF